jgi:hypothetical protein
MKFLVLTICALFLSSDIAHTKPANDQVQRGLTLAEQVYNTDNPVQTRSNLTVEEQNLVDGVTQPGALKVHFQLIGGAKNRDAKNLVAYINGTENRDAENRGGENLIAAYTGCWAWNQTYERKAILGNTLYTYWQTTKVCAVNGRVTSVAVTNADGETSTPGWRIAGAPRKSAKSVGWEGRGLARFYFVLGSGGFDVQSPSNCIQQRLNANGRDRRSMSSCNLDAP